MLTCTPPMEKVEAKIATPTLKPGIWLMSAVATLPVISFVMAMLRPCSIRNVDSVTRKLCSLVRIRR